MALGHNGETLTSPDERHAFASARLESYALGALDPNEAGVVDAHLDDDDCLDCQKETSLLRRIVGVLPLGLELHRPSADLRAQILTVVISEPSGSGNAVRSHGPAGLLQRIRAFFSR